MFILKTLKVVYFDTLLQVFILKVLTDSSNLVGCGENGRANHWGRARARQAQVYPSAIIHLRNELVKGGLEEFGDEGGREDEAKPAALKPKAAAPGVDGNLAEDDAGFIADFEVPVE